MTLSADEGQFPPESEIDAPERERSLRSRGVPAVGLGDDHLPDLPPTRHQARWFRPSRPSALRL